MIGRGTKKAKKARMGRALALLPALSLAGCLPQPEIGRAHV